MERKGDERTKTGRSSRYTGRPGLYHSYRIVSYRIAWNILSKNSFSAGETRHYGCTAFSCPFESASSRVARPMVSENKTEATIDVRAHLRLPKIKIAQDKTRRDSPPPTSTSGRTDASTLLLASKKDWISTVTPCEDSPSNIVAAAEYCCRSGWGMAWHGIGVRCGGGRATKGGSSTVTGGGARGLHHVRSISNCRARCGSPVQHRVRSRKCRLPDNTAVASFPTAPGRTHSLATHSRLANIQNQPLNGSQIIKVGQTKKEK